MQATRAKALYVNVSNNISLHSVCGVGDVAVITLGGEPFCIVVPMRESLRLIWADNPAIGPLEVLRAIERNGPMASPQIAEYLGLRGKIVSCHLRTLLSRGTIRDTGKDWERRRDEQPYPIYALA